MPATHFYKVVIKETLLLFLRNAQAVVAYIPDRNNSICEHFIFPTFNAFINFLLRQVSLCYNCKNKVDQAFFFGNKSFKMTELEMTMTIDKTRRENSVKCFNVFTGISNRDY